MLSISVVVKVGGTTLAHQQAVSLSLTHTSCVQSAHEMHSYEMQKNVQYACSTMRYQAGACCLRNVWCGKLAPPPLHGSASGVTHESKRRQHHLAVLYHEAFKLCNYIRLQCWMPLCSEPVLVYVDLWPAFDGFPTGQVQQETRPYKDILKA